MKSRRGVLVAVAVWLASCGAPAAAPPRVASRSNAPAAQPPPPQPAQVAPAPSPSPLAPATILPAPHPRPAQLAALFDGGGPCRTDSDCTVSSETGTCNPCGGCASAMTTAEASRRAAVACPRRRRRGTESCSDCPPGPARAVCVDSQCTGVADPPAETSACTRDDDCRLVAFGGCCACPARWMAVRADWLEQTIAFCAAQACGGDGASCPALPARWSAAFCDAGVCSARP